VIGFVDFKVFHSFEPSAIVAEKRECDEKAQSDKSAHKPKG
jgi:hypothetical protein